MVLSNASLTLLEFSPLQASHAGVYTCKATVNGVMAENNALVTVMSKRKINTKVYNVTDLVNCVYLCSSI